MTDTKARKPRRDARGRYKRPKATPDVLQGVIAVIEDHLPYVTCGLMAGLERQGLVEERDADAGRVKMTLHGIDAEGMNPREALTLWCNRARQTLLSVG